MRLHKPLIGIACALALQLLARASQAAPPWVDRPLTLPSGDWAFDFGLGVGHVPAPVDDTAAGVNAEMAVGLTSRVELGLRTGLRFGDDADRGNNADTYGRLFDRQSFGVGAEGAEVLANPELRVRGALVREPVVELALEGRVVLPFADDSVAGVMFGVPMAFHLGSRVRLDLGVYVPVVFFQQDAVAAVRVPFDVWIQATSRLWLGPMTGLVFDRVGDTNGSTSLSLGFGLGYEITRFLDFKTMFLFPTINNDSRVFGAGAGLQVRIE
jgi:hypothetical protein